MPGDPPQFGGRFRYETAAIAAGFEAVDLRLERADVAGIEGNAALPGETEAIRSVEGRRLRIGREKRD